jgi:Tol biopolymer transport system component/DNA-binding winged helix-turn-helix (wHTH) protein
MSPEVLEFGDVTVDLRRMSVMRAGRPVSLEPKTFDVLRYLIEHRDRLVTKEELLDAAWKDTFVTPNVLTRAVAQMRKALGDDAFEARYIETVAKRGYRFIAPVTVHGAEASAPSRPAAPHASPATSPVAASPARRRSVGAVAAIGVIIAAIGFGIYAMRDHGPAAISDAATEQLPMRRFTTGSQSYSFPSISPDGRTIAYSSDVTGAMEIYTAGLTPGNREVALTSDGGQNMNAEWSPDGQWISYHSRKNGGIWIVPSSGGTARRVVEFGSQASWTPDGRRLVFTSDAGGMAVQSILWSVDRDGGDRRQVTKLGAPRGGHSKPAISSNGRLVVFGVTHGHIGVEVWTMPMDAEIGTKIGDGHSARFSPDGSAVYWISRTPEGNDTLMRVGIDERGAPTGQAEEVQQFAGNFVGGFSIARNGNTVLWLFRGAGNIWAVDVPSPGVKAAPPVALTSDDVRNSYPSHSREGRIAFQQFAPGQPPSVWAIDEDGKNREALTVGLSVGVWNPQWTPDGKRLFVQTGARGQKTRFAWLDVATKQLTPLAISTDGILSQRLSPDGREIVFHVIDAGGVINVWTQVLDGGSRKQLTFDSEAMSYPMWSPDGRSLVVEIKRGDDTHMGVMSRDGGPVELLVTERGQSWPYSWAPDNDRIAFAGARDGVWNIYTVSRSTKAITQLTDFNSVQGYVRYPSWSPARPRIVFERAEQRGSLWTAKLR